jgi:anti-sigma regulatory factor (Ser/Thr protein kinase)
MRAQEFERVIWLRADPSSASVAREFAREAAQDVGCDRAGMEAFRLGITEAVANAVEHGAPCHNGLISVSAYLEGGCLTTEILDCGDFKAARQPATSLEERGRGLPLMFAVMDHVEIETVPGRTVVRLAKQLPS